MNWVQYRSTVGQLLLCSDGTALKSISLGALPPGQPREDAVLCRTRLWLDRYFRG